MTTQDFKKIARILKEAYKELEQEALSSNVDIFGEEYKQAQDIVREQVLKRMGFTLEEYRQAKEEYTGNKKTTDKLSKVENELNTLKDKSEQVIPTKEEIKSIAEQVVKAPQIINKIVKETTKVVEKPIKETVIQQEEYDPSALWAEIGYLNNRLDNLKIPELPKLPTEQELEEKIKTSTENSFKHSIDLLGMPNFRKLAMGLESRISSLESNPSSGGGTWGSITGTLSNQTDLQTVLDTIPSYGTTTQIPYMNAGGTDFLYSSNFVFTGTKFNLTGTDLSEIANFNSTITGATNNRTLRISTTNNQTSGGGTATGGLFIQTIDNGITTGGAAMATLGMQFVATRSATFNNSGIAGTLRAVQGTVTDSGTYSRATAQSVTLDGFQATVSPQPVITGGQTVTYTANGLSINFSGDATVTSGTLNSTISGIKLTGGGAVAGTTLYRAFYNSANGYDTNWTLYNDTANNNFMGYDNSKSYFGTGADASIYYDGTDMFINPKEVGTGVLNISGNLALGTNSLTMTGSIGATGARVTKLWATDIESINMPTVGGTIPKLSAFSATTSAELAGVISDETGSGALVFADTPTMITPVLSGTPNASGELGRDATQLAPNYYDNGRVGIIPKVVTSDSGTQSITDSTASDQDFTAIDTIPANTLFTGKKLRVTLMFEMTTGVSTNTLALYLKLGSTKVFTQTPQNFINSSTINFTMQFIISGRASASASSAVTTSAVIGMGANLNGGNITNQPVNLATNGSLDIVPGGTFSGTGSTETLQLLDWLVEELY